LDGDQHGEDEHRAKDAKRDTWLKTQGYTVIRVWNGELYDNLDGVMDEIYRYLISGCRENDKCLPSSGQAS